MIILYILKMNYHKLFLDYYFHNIEYIQDYNNLKMHFLEYKKYWIKLLLILIYYILQMNMMKFLLIDEVTQLFLNYYNLKMNNFQLLLNLILLQM